MCGGAHRWIGIRAPPPAAIGTAMPHVQGWYRGRPSGRGRVSEGRPGPPAGAARAALRPARAEQQLGGAYSRRDVLPAHAAASVQRRTASWLTSTCPLVRSRMSAAMVRQPLPSARCRAIQSSTGSPRSIPASRWVGVMGETLDRNGTLVNYLDVES